MDSNPTICEEKLTTSNPNRKWGFMEEKKSAPSRFVSAEPSSGLWGVILVMLDIDGCIKRVKIYKNLGKVWQEKLAVYD